MGIEKTHGRNYDLARLLAAIDRGEIVLPEFQRGFVWDTTAVKQLIATCLTGWPIGSLLLLPGRSRIFFKVREFDSAQGAQSSFQFVVLDGQQRLTSLYQALYARGDFRYGVKFSLLRPDQQIEELEDAILSMPSDKWRRTYPNAESEYRDGIVPVNVLRYASDFYAWRDRATQSTPQSDRASLTDLYVSSLSGLDRYEVPAVVIDDEVHPEAVARIFERVNRLGQPLGTFDLMVAKSFAREFNLRDEWDRAQIDFPRLADFLKGDGLPVLGVIALQVRESVRQADILQLSGASVRDYWERATRALDKAIAYLQERFSVWAPDWLPYRAQLTVLGCLALNDRLTKDEASVSRWFWASVFQSRYDVASNTRAVEDYRRLLEGVTPSVNEIVLDPDTFYSANRRQLGALHRGLICLLASRGPLDPFLGLPVAESLSRGEDEPVTMSFLGKEQSPWDLPGHLHTLGMLLTTRRNSRGKGLIDLAGLDTRILTSQLLPLESGSTSIESLFAQRLDLIAPAIASASGIPTRVATFGEEFDEASFDGVPQPFEMAPTSGAGVLLEETTAESEELAADRISREIVASLAQRDIEELATHLRLEQRVPAEYDRWLISGTAKPLGGRRLSVDEMRRVRAVFARVVGQSSGDVS